MAITVEELPGYLRRLSEKARREGPIRAVTAMGQAYQGVVVRSMHGPAPSPPGTPPARRTGTLARSIRVAPARMISAYAAQNSVGPHTVYARIQQLGGDIHVVRKKVLANKATGQIFGTHVTLPARPYMVMSSEARTACHDAAVRAANELLA